ncbi:MAG: DTW domain-containing protein [Verrucomicrobia bacterium]|nr:DTW domain-containing protein [Verrucomicrobiota bacterium]
MRSVVLQSSRRCPHCLLPLRWCTCAGLRAITCPLQIDVLMHHRERFRPSSTGNLIHRALPGSRNHLWRRERRLEAAEIRVAGRELWIVHPAGGPVPRGVAPEEVQVLLLDGSWREASAMAREVGSWGRSVSLPMAGESRFWLRAQQDGGRFSTVECLLFLLRSFGLERAHAELQIQFELHVYAGLRARGSKDAALEFLKNSPLPAALPELLAQFDVRRPRCC